MKPRWPPAVIKRYPFSIETMKEILALLKDRPTGRTSIRFVQRCGKVVPDVLKDLGLNESGGELRIIDLLTAKSILREIFQHDLQYWGEVMPQELATEHAENIISLIYRENSQIYTNGPWEELQVLRHSTGYSFSNLTDSTFDAGIVVISDDYAAAVLVEEED